MTATVIFFIGLLTWWDVGLIRNAPHSVEIILNSEGGNMFTMGQIIREMKKRHVTINIVATSSAASIITCYADELKAHKFATGVVMHTARNSAGIPVTYSNRKKNSNLFNQMQRIYKDCKLDYKVIKKLNEGRDVCWYVKDWIHNRTKWQVC